MPRIVDIKANNISPDHLWIHDEKDKTKANLISRFFNNDFEGVYFPRPFGVIYAHERPIYDEEMTHQIHQANTLKGKMPLDHILSGDKTWEI